MPSSLEIFVTQISQSRKNRISASGHSPLAQPFAVVLQATRSTMVKRVFEPAFDNSMLQFYRFAKLDHMFLPFLRAETPEDLMS